MEEKNQKVELTEAEVNLYANDCGIEKFTCLTDCILGLGALISHDK